MIWLLAILGGILGRTGGAHGYDTKYRDFGIPALVCLSIGLVYGFSWWFLLIFLLTFAALTTYWDKLFGYDNLWFSGLVTGLTLYSARPIGITPEFIIIRSIGLCLIWGLLNKYMPRKLLFWRGDVANEFLRYFSVIITLAFL